MFLKSLSICCRAVLGKPYSVSGIAARSNQSCLLPLYANFSMKSTFQNDDSDDEPSQRKAKFYKKITNNQNTFNSPSVRSDRSRDSHYNLDKQPDEAPDWKPFKKDFYQPLDIIYPKVDIDNFLKQHEITVKGQAPNPILLKIRQMIVHSAL